MDEQVRKHKIQIIGGLALLGMAVLGRRIKHIRTTELLNIPTSETLQKMNAYRFATTAFVYSGGMVTLGGVVCTSLLWTYLGVDNLNDFTAEFRKRLHLQFPSLRITNDAYQDNGYEEFMKEWNAVPEEPEYRESPPHALIGHTIRWNLGPLATKKD
ncbi:hypothetical protein EDD86DRAFT_212338, partial [Gorgonomyces haynaldii]